MIPWWILGACTQPRLSLDPSTQGPTTPVPSSSGTTGDTAPPAVDCSLLVGPGDATVHESPILIEEDFDFDGDGNLLTEGSNGLVAIDREGRRRPASGVRIDNMTGVRSTVSGDVAIVDSTAGAIRLIDLRSGGADVIFTGMSYPNGIEAGVDGMLYVAELHPSGVVRQIDPATGIGTVALDHPFTNGIVLSPDEQTLYVGIGGAGLPDTSIVAVSRRPDGTFDPSTAVTVYVAPSVVASLTVDACGNVYGVSYASGRVFRIDPVTREVAVIVELGDGGYAAFSALHFSPGLGGWDETALYVSNRMQSLFEIPTGVPGSHVLAGQ